MSGKIVPGLGDCFRSFAAAADAVGASEIPMITLWAPFAHLIFAGAKLHETRSFKPPLAKIGVPVAIHVAKTKVQDWWISPELDELCDCYLGPDWCTSVPRGCVLGTVVISGFVPTDGAQPERKDRIAGDWTPGRFAWPLRDIVKFDEPVPAIGKQGWGKFKMEPPHE